MPLRIISFLLLAAPFMSAQISTATVTGIVNDPSGAALVGVSIQLANQDTGVTLTESANPRGEYTFPLLQPGRYRLSVEANGFRRYSRSDIVLEGGRITRLDVPMQLGQVSETVEVTGSAPLLESESSTLGQFIENKTIIDMPLNGRRVGELLALMGNAVYVSGDVIRPRVAIAGGRADQQQWMIDGVNASNIALEVPQALFNPPVEAVQEIRILQNSYSAEFGNSSSGVVTMTTRSGTNDLHGSLYEFFRNDKLDARNTMSATKAPLRWNIFGYAVGGPIIRNRTFFFTNTEYQKQRVGATRTVTTPTARQLAGDFSQTLTATGALIRIYDPATTRADPANAGRMIRDPFLNNMIPANRIDSVGSKIATLFPGPTGAGANRAGANNFVRNSVMALNITTWTSKVDHIFTQKDRVSVRFILHDFPTNTTSAFDVGPADPNSGISERRAYSTLIDEVHTFSGTLLNEFRFNWQPRNFHAISLGLGEGWPTRLGLKGVADRAFPRINATGFTSLGNGTQERVQIPIHDTDFVESLSWFRGSHSFRFGAELRLGRNVDMLDTSISGTLGFGTEPSALPTVANTGSAIASLLLGIPNSGSIATTDRLDRRSKYIALFAQDDWKATRNLTVNLGLRWEAHTPRTDANNRQNGFSATAINPVSNTPGVVTFAGRDGLSSQIYEGDYNNFGPRIGIAWKAFGDPKMVVRSGYGIFYQTPLPGSNNTSAGFETSGTFSTPDNGITPPFLLREGFPSTARQELGPGFGAVRVGQPVRFAPEFIEGHRQLGYSQQWNFGIQRDIGFDTVFEATYLGNAGRKINGPNTSINQVRPELMGSGNAQVRRPFPQFGNVTLVTPMWGNSSYHALNLKVEKRFTHGLNFLANYTFSKFIDDVTSGFEVGDVGGGIQNFYDRRAEKSLSGNDVRNRFVLSSVYELPLKKGVLGGWSVGFIAILQQGSPVGLVTQTNTTNAFNPGSQRVNVLRSPALPVGERTTGRWFDTSAVEAPAPFTFGNAGRALLTGPGFLDMNLSLLKNFRFKERFNLQFRGEAFNFINHPNYGEPGKALGAATFGVIGSAKDARILQFGLKLEF